MWRSLSRLAAVPVVLVLAAGQPPDKKDPQNAFEPRGKPGAGQKFLERMAGDWAVAKAFHPSGGGEPSRTTGECRQTMIHGGRFLRSEFTFAADGGASTGTGLIGYEPQTDRFTSVWIDSRQTRMSLRQSEGKFGGAEIVLFGAGLEGAAKEGAAKAGRRSKTVTRLEADGQDLCPPPVRGRPGRGRAAGDGTGDDQEGGPGAWQVTSGSRMEEYVKIR